MYLIPDDTAEDILNQILSARRLLAEHVDIVAVILEQLQLESPNAKRDQPAKTVLGGILVTGGTSLIAVCSWSRRFSVGSIHQRSIQIVPLTALFVGWSCYFGWRWHQRYIFNGGMTQLSSFIDNLNAYDVAVRRNLKFIKESNRLNENSTRAYSEKCLNMKSVHSIMVVIRELVDAIRTLEQNPLPFEMLDVYQPLELLETCELFERPPESMEPSHLKDFHKIFQYVQSQLLTRFSIAIVHNSDAALQFMANVFPKLNSMLLLQLRLDADIQKSLTASIDMQYRLDERRSHHPDGTPVNQTMSHLRSISLDVVARFLAVAGKIRSLDEVFQSESDENSYIISDQITAMEQIETSLGECVEDYRRLVLSYNRLVHGKVIPTESKSTLESTETDDTADPQMFNDALLINHQEQPDSEFYALFERDPHDDITTDANHLERKLPKVDDELLAMDIRLVKRHFKPVLSQLKQRIEPINAAMRDRERKFLQEKGFDGALEEAEEAEKSLGNGETEVNSSSDDDELDAIGRLRKKKPKVDNYDELRKFLGAKQQINLMAMQGTGFLPPPRRMIEEDILE